MLIIGGGGPYAPPARVCDSDNLVRLRAVDRAREGAGMTAEQEERWRIWQDAHCLHYARDQFGVHRPMPVEVRAFLSIGAGRLDSERNVDQ